MSLLKQAKGSTGEHTFSLTSMPCEEKEDNVEELPPCQAPPLNITVMVDDWPILMEVDTGAALSLVSKSTHRLKEVVDLYSEVVLIATQVANFCVWETGCRSEL